MEHLTNDDLAEIIHYLERFRDSCRTASLRQKAEGVARRSKAWAENADRLIDLCKKEMKTD